MAFVAPGLILVVEGAAGALPQVFFRLVLIPEATPVLDLALFGQLFVSPKPAPKSQGPQGFPGIVADSPEGVIGKDHLCHGGGEGTGGRIGQRDGGLGTKVAVPQDLQVQILVGKWRLPRACSTYPGAPGKP